MRRVVLLALMVCYASSLVQAQKKPAAAASSLCTKDNAAETTKQQILQTRTFDNPVQRIAVLLRAADLLWPHDQERALATFMEAFDLAVLNFKENGDQVKRTSQSRFAATIQLPDQRFKVLAAIAKRDPATARKLSKQLLSDDAKEMADKPATDEQSKRRAAEKVLTLAYTLAKDDPATAVIFARQSLRYPASMFLATFIYQLARVNRQAADQFYLDALNAYGEAPMDQFLYLSAYPFGNQRDAGEMPGYTGYIVPEGYVPNRALKRQFLQTLLARTESSLATEMMPSARYTDQAQMWLALNRLEKQVQAELPDLFDAAMGARDKLFALLTPRAQQNVKDVISSDNEPDMTFDGQVELALKQTNIGRRDQYLSAAVTRLSKGEPVEKVLSTIDKISDENVRPPLLNMFYYFRTQAMISDKNFTEARKLANRVTELDQRAYLFTRIAEESLKQTEDQTEARDVLNEISDAVSKAPKTIVSARALLALAYLYARVDLNRGIEQLGNAVTTINALQSPDFSQQFMMMKIEGKTFGTYYSFPVPGFNPESAFGEMGKLDFDGSLNQATRFTDKSLRALTTLAVIEPCFTSKSRKKS